MMWRDGSEDLGRAVAPIREELEARIEVYLDERDRLAVSTALAKATIAGCRAGYEMLRESVMLDCALQGVELKLAATISIPDKPDAWEAYDEEAA